MQNTTAPTGLILVVVPFLLDEDEPGRIVKTPIGALPSGSYVAATHGSAEYTPRDGFLRLARVYDQGGICVQWRSADEFADLVFKDLTLVPSGVVPISERRPEPGALLPTRIEVGGNAAVARKP